MMDRVLQFMQVGEGLSARIDEVMEWSSRVVLVS